MDSDDPTSSSQDIQRLFDEGSKSHDLQNFEDAEKFLGEALSLFIEHQADDALFLTNLYIGLGSAQYMMKKYRSALDSFRKALGVIETSRGYNHTFSAPVHLNIALCHIATEAFVPALKELGRARSIIESSRSADRAMLGDVLHNKAYIHDCRGELKEAAATYAAAVRIKSRTLGEGHPETARSQFCLGQVLRDLGRSADAARNLELALSSREAQLGSAHPDTALSQLALAQLLAKQNALEKAAPLAAAAAATLKEALGPRNPHTRAARSLHNFIRTHTRASGRYRMPPAPPRFASAE